MPRVKTVEVTAAVTDTVHDGRSTIVLSEGKKVRVAEYSLDYLRRNKLIVEGEADGDTRVGGQNFPKADGVQTTAGGSLAELLVIAADEGVIPDLGEMQRQLESAIERKRAENAEANPLDHDGDGEAGGSKPHDPPSLSGKNKAELTAIAEAEGVELEDGMTNDAIREAIEAARDAADAPPAN